MLTKKKNLFLKAKPTQIPTIRKNNFQTKFIHKSTKYMGKINTVKSQQQTTNRQQGKQIILTDTEGQTNKL